MDGVKLPADFDALLRQTMAEEPSVEFLPRVRERIATEQVAPRWSWRLTFAGVGAAAVIAIALVAGAIDDVQAPPAPVAPRLAYMMAPAVPAPPRMPDLPTTSREAVRIAAPVSGASGAAMPVAGLPTVVVDGRQRFAIGRLMRMVAQGSVTEENFALSPPPSLRPITERIGEIAVVPVEVSPIESGGVLQVGPEPKQPPRPAEAGFRP